VQCPSNFGVLVPQRVPSPRAMEAFPAAKEMLGDWGSADNSSHHVGAQAELCALLQQHHMQLVRHLDDVLALRQRELLAVLAARASAAAPGLATSSTAAQHLAGPNCGAAGGAKPSAAAVTLHPLLDERRPSVTSVGSRFSDVMAKRILAARQDGRRVTPPLEKQGGWRWREKLGRLVGSNRFEGLCCLLIVSNAVFFGVEAQYMAKERLQKTPLLFEIVAVCYTLLFSAELLLRMSANVSEFFFSEQRLWNCADVVIVIISLVELPFQIARIDFRGGQNLTYVRIIRMARIVRIFRVIRVLKAFTSLRVLVYGVLSTLRSLIWTLVLLTIILYLFSLLFMQAANDHMVTFGDVPEVTKYYGDLPRSVFTLFKAVTGGVDWQEVSAPLGIVNPLWEIVFVIFIAFTYFAVLNVVTGTFCQSAIESANHDKDVVVHAQMSIKQRYTEQLQDLFKTMDPTNTGRITLNNFEEALCDHHVQAYFRSLEITVDDAWNLFRLLDDNESNSIDLEEFVTGCLRLRGSARSIDIHMLMYESKWTMRKLSEVLAAFHDLRAFLGADQAPTFPAKTLMSTMAKLPPEEACFEWAAPEPEPPSAPGRPTRSLFTI